MSLSRGIACFIWKARSRGAVEEDRVSIVEHLDAGL